MSVDGRPPKAAAHGMRRPREYTYWVRLTRTRIPGSEMGLRLTLTGQALGMTAGLSGPLSLALHIYQLTNINIQKVGFC